MELIEIRLVQPRDYLKAFELRVGANLRTTSKEDFYIYEYQEGPPFHVVIYRTDICEAIEGFHFLGISEEIRKLDLKGITYHLVRHPDLFHLIEIERRSDEKFYVNVTLGFSSNDWKMPWSFSEYQDAVTGILQQQFTTYEIEFPDQNSDHVVIAIPVDEPNRVIATELERCHSIFQDLHELAESSLRANLSADSVVMFFDFADEVKVPCEQYLLYFAQFLKDLGVEAQTALTNEAGKVLFTVTPNDKTKALDQIRTALDVYLHLPSSPLSDAPGESIAVQRLEANILRLRSDLKLAAAELQAKETTVEAQRLIIDVQKKMLNGEILFDSVKNVTPKHEDKEYLIDGIVALSTYEDKGLAIHLGEMLRRLKQLFTKTSE